jgi:hypothetical protein
VPATASPRDAAIQSVGRLFFLSWPHWACAPPSTRLGPGAAADALRRPSAAEALLGRDLSRVARHGVQARLSQFLARLRLHSLLNCTLMSRSGCTGPQRIARARLLSQCARGAMLWCGEAGGRAGTRLSSDVFRLSALRAVGLQDDTPDEGVCHTSACEARGARLTPLHRRLCGWYRTNRHHLQVRRWEQCIKESRVGLVQRESTAPFAARLRPRSNQVRAVGRIDLMVIHDCALNTGDPELDGKPWALDVCIGGPSASGVCEYSYHTAGATVAMLDASKHFHYRTPGTSKSLTRAFRGRVLDLPPSTAPKVPLVGPAAQAAAALFSGPRPNPQALWTPADCLYDSAAFTLVPLSQETDGRLGPDALRLLRGMATHATGGPGDDGDPVARGRLVQRWLRLLSCGLTRAVSVQALSHPGPLLAPSRVVVAARRSSLPAPSVPVSASGLMLGGAPALPGSLAAASSAVGFGGSVEGSAAAGSP